MNIYLHNRFDFTILDAKTKKVKNRVRAFNVICNGLWSRLFSYTTSDHVWAPYPYFNYIVIGDGNGTPQVTDTSLFNLRGAKRCTSYSGTGDYKAQFCDKRWDINAGWISGSKTVTLEAGDFVGVNITEIGIAYDVNNLSNPTSAPLATHAMLQDMNGNPLSIQKTATDVIQIKATIYIHIPNGGFLNGSLQTKLVNDTNGLSFFSLLLGDLPDPPGTFRRITEYISATSAVVCQRPYSLNPASFNNKIFEESNSLTKPLQYEQNYSQRKMIFKYRYEATDTIKIIRFIEIRSPGTDRFILKVDQSWYTFPEIKKEPVGTGDGVNTDFCCYYPSRSINKVYINDIEVSASAYSIRTGPEDDYFLKYFNLLGGSFILNNGALWYSDIGGSSNIELHTDYINITGSNGNVYLFENPYYQYGIIQFDIDGTRYANIDVSDDLVNWTNITPSGSTQQRMTVSIPSALQHSRFWRVRFAGYDYSTNLHIYKPTIDHSHPNANIRFNNPPESGSIVTVDYVPDCVPKNENNVFDIQLDLNFSDYSGG